MYKYALKKEIAGIKIPVVYTVIGKPPPVLIAEN